MSHVIDIHAIQTLPPSLVNRDDTGAPKTAIFGGVPRQRVSSQSWKRAIRKYFKSSIDGTSIGMRSREIPEVIFKAVKEFDTTMPDAEILDGVRALFKAAKIKLVEPTKKEVEDGASPIPTISYLCFFSSAQIKRAAEEIIKKNGEKFSAAEAKEILNDDISFDIAMFGRMLADAPTYNVDASVQVAHALSVHETTPEFDYFTAVDDAVEEQDETGAGMIGNTQMMSSTLYRFATINFDGLANNLGDATAAQDAVGHFIRAFAESMPTGKQNSFANNTLPELLYVCVRDTRSVSLINAFEEPISGSSSGRRAEAAEALAREAIQVEQAYGFKPVASFVMALGDLSEPFSEIAEKVTLPELVEKIETALPGVDNKDF